MATPGRSPVERGAGPVSQFVQQAPGRVQVAARRSTRFTAGLLRLTGNLRGCRSPCAGLGHGGLGVADGPARMAEGPHHLGPRPNRVSITLPGLMSRVHDPVSGGCSPRARSTPVGDLLPAPASGAGAGHREAVSRRGAARPNVLPSRCTGTCVGPVPSIFASVSKTADDGRVVSAEGPRDWALPAGTGPGRFASGAPGPSRRVFHRDDPIEADVPGPGRPRPCPPRRRTAVPEFVAAAKEPWLCPWSRTSVTVLHRIRPSGRRGGRA